MKLIIVGATGLVGTEIIKILEEKKIKKIKSIFFVASQKSTGKYILFNNQKHKIIPINEAILKKPQYVLFSAGSKTSLKHAKTFTDLGAVVIDNSSAFRMSPKIKLIVPEINGNKITKEDKIIANPNCSTIQLVMALYPIHKKHNIKRVVVSTYQAIVGTGQLALQQLEKEEANEEVLEAAYADKIHRNIIPKCDDFNEDGYTKEEQKIIDETNKILDSSIKITATAVRTPTIGGHGESVNVEFKNPIKVSEISELLTLQDGVVVYSGEKYITPIESRGKDDVFVSRLRRDYSVESGINMWIVADPLRKGAATNAIQILESIINNQ